MSYNLPGVSDSLRGVSDSLHGVSDSLRGVSDSLHGVSDSIPGVSDSLLGVSDSLRGVSDSLRGVSHSLHGQCLTVLLELSLIDIINILQIKFILINKYFSPCVTRQNIFSTISTNQPYPVPYTTQSKVMNRTQKYQSHPCCVGLQ